MAYTFPNSVPSGVNITPYVSGTDSIGTPASPFLSGNFLNITSPTLTSASFATSSISTSGIYNTNIINSSGVIGTSGLTVWTPGYTKLFGTAIAAGDSVYGTWDGSNYWGGSQNINSIYKIGPTGNIIATYSGFASIQQLQWDGRYIWVASYNTSGTLYKFDPIAQVITGTYNLNPSLNGSGGIQGLTFDGSYLWAGNAQSAGTGTNTGQVLKISSSGTILQTTVGQTNVNGMLSLNITGTQYIFSANTSFIGKINATGNTYQSIPTPGANTYRICTDGTYIYGVDFSTANIYKFNPNTLQTVASFPTAAQANDIKFDGANLWVIGNTDAAWVHDPNTGAVLQIIPSGGYASLVYDGTYMWSQDNSNSSVNKMTAGNSINNLKVYNTFGVANSGNQASFYVGENGTATALDFTATQPSYAFLSSTGVSATYTPPTTAYMVTSGLVFNAISGSNFTITASNPSRITYTGTQPIIANVQASASFNATNSSLYGLSLGLIVNGNNALTGVMYYSTQGAGDVGGGNAAPTYSLNAIIPMITGTYIQIGNINSTGTASCNNSSFQLSVTKVL